jgi:broad specificity phosphatase PhoE
MSFFLLVRHAATDAPSGTILGRIPGIHLSQEGIACAQRLAREFRSIDIQELWSSPLERALETAEPLADAALIPIRICQELNEFDYGEWAGRPLTELEKDPRWRRFNRERVDAPVPGGETARDVSKRVAALLARLRSAAGVIVMVTHAEIIRAALANCLRTPNDLFDRVEISHASVTIIRAENDYSQVLMVNGFAELGASGIPLRQGA